MSGYSSMVGGLELERPYRTLLDDDDRGALVILEVTLKRNAEGYLRATVTVPQHVVASGADWRTLADRAVESLGIKAKRGASLRAADDLRVVYWVESMHGF